MRTETPSPFAAAYIEKILADWPPLTDQQRTALAELLKPARVGGAADD